MNSLKFSGRAVAMLLVLGLVFTGCSKDEPLDVQLEDSKTEELVLASEMDKTSEVLDDIMIQIYEAQEADELGKQPLDVQSIMPDCVTVTVVISQQFRSVTIDFGTEGCLVNGHFLKGKIIMSYERDPAAMEVLISFVLEDFEFDAKQILGSSTVLKQLSNDAGNPQFTHTLNFTVIWPNGVQASRDGQKVREWVEGFASGVWSDNVFEITGHWNSTFVNGNTHTNTVMIPLRREVICFYFVSGTVDVVRTNFSGLFDYGDGSCDNTASFTFANGEVIEIILN